MLRALALTVVAVVGMGALAGCAGPDDDRIDAWLRAADARTAGREDAVGGGSGRITGAAAVTLDYRADPVRPTAIEATCLGEEAVIVSWRITAGDSVGVGEVELDCARPPRTVALDPDTVGEVDEMAFAVSGGSADGAFAVTVIGE